MDKEVVWNEFQLHYASIMNLVHKGAFNLIVEKYILTEEFLSEYIHRIPLSSILKYQWFSLNFFVANLSTFASDPHYVQYLMQNGVLRHSHKVEMVNEAKKYRNLFA
jgi:hypothetical protein